MSVTTRKILYTIIVVLIGVIVWQQMYHAPADKEGVIAPAEVSSGVDGSSSVIVNDSDAATTSANNEAAPESVFVTGTYIGLRDEVGGNFEETSMYLLLDDGTEIISIDLRPLVGTQKTGIESELGISRGDRLELIGETVEGSFVLSEVVVRE